MVTFESISEIIDIIETELSIECTTDDAENLIDEMYRKNDFTIEIDGCEYRFINDSAIWDIYFDEQKDLIEECYINDLNKEWWIVIDWEATIDNVYSADGYGHHFATYDGSEYNINWKNELWYIFRTN
jgi:hypothetical protein